MASRADASNLGKTVNAVAVSIPAPVILCIEDQASSLAMRKMILEESGYTVLSASSAKEALKQLAASHIDLVLSDHYLRGELGTAIAAQIKALKPDIPVLLISGAEDISKASCVDGIICKTDGPTDLLVAIARALRL
jgi:DNA-binding NtrC family response regulator